MCLTFQLLERDFAESVVLVLPSPRGTVDGLELRDVMLHEAEELFLGNPDVEQSNGSLQSRPKIEVDLQELAHYVCLNDLVGEVAVVFDEELVKVVVVE